MKRTALCFPVLAALAASSAAIAQSPCASPPDNCVNNGSFESPSPFGGGVEPTGWHNHSNPSECIYRRNGVSVAGHPDVVARTGVRCLEVSGPGDGHFRSFSTDTRNFFASGFPFYDPMFDWNGGDLVVEAWFMVPESDPVTGDFGAISLALKGAADPNQNVVEVSPFANGGLGLGPPVFRITGHTCGQWIQYRSVIPMAYAHQQFLDNGFNEAVDGVPNRIKIVMGRWNFDIAGTGTGSIFWDDVVFKQLPVGIAGGENMPPVGSTVCGAPPCAADFNQDGDLNPDDLGDFITCYFTEPPCPGADFNHDSDVNPDDLGDFITAYFQGC